MSLAICASAQSLGDVAREQKSQPKTEKAKRVYTNDDMPSVAPPAAPAAPARAGNAASAKGPSAEDRKKRDDDYKMKINDAKAKVADLQREIELMDREYKLRAAVFYSDAGNRLRDDKKWADAERKYKEDSAAKSAGLQAAKDKLESMKEEARKAGVMGLE